MSKATQTPAPMPAARRRTQHERSEETRTKLLEAAVDCICEFGYAATTTSIIALRAGVSRGALQHQFRSRSDLLVAEVEYIGRQISAEIGSVPAGAPVGERIDICIRSYWRVYTSKAFVAATQILFGAKDDPELFARIRAVMQELEAAHDRHWQRIFADVGAPPARVASVRHVVLGTLRGLAFRQQFQPGKAAWSDELVLLRDMVVDSLAKGASGAGSRPRRGQRAKP